MPVDNSPAQSAQSLLNGIDYAALIGGPLQAAIKAQAMAANSTWEFIQQVGLNTDKDGNRSAINVTFMYQRDGEMVKLIVPLLTIVPVPLIVIDEVSIDFTANINASASSTTEDTKSEDIGGELEAEGKIGWGPFSLSARMKASYSSKQSSKATQDSRYSVEYTQVVKVHATQADMPAGLSTVLNILSSAATGGSKSGQLTVSPAVATVDPANPNAMQMIEIRTVDANGLNVATDVTIAVASRFKGCFQFYDVLSGVELKWTDGTDLQTLLVKTNGRGRIALNLGPGATPVPATPPLPVFRISATIKGDKEPQEVMLPVRVLLAAGKASLSVSPSPLSLPNGDGAEITIKGTNPDGTPAAGEVKLSGVETTILTYPPTVTLQQGEAKARLKWAGSDRPPQTLKLEGAFGGQRVDTSLEVKPQSQSLHLNAPQPSVAVPGLNAMPVSTTQAWTVLMQGHEGRRQPVRVLYDPGSVNVRHAGKPISSGDTLPLDERGMARLEFEVASSAVSGQSEVVLETVVEGNPVRKTIPVQIS
jgi:hypothetical protein